jgi:hypothetical protein
MADLTITAANVVVATSVALDKNSFAGETITAGQAVYKKSSDSKWWKAQADGTAEESGVGVSYGIAVTGASAGQFIVVCTGGGTVTLGTGTAGTLYVVSATAGGIAPIADLVSTNKLTILGWGITGGGGISLLSPYATGVAIP